MFGLADRGNKNKVKELGVGNVLVTIGKKPQTNEKLNRNPNRNFNGTYEQRSAVTSQTRPTVKN